MHSEEFLLKPPRDIGELSSDDPATRDAQEFEKACAQEGQGKLARTSAKHTPNTLFGIAAMIDMLPFFGFCQLLRRRSKRSCRS